MKKESLFKTEYNKANMIDVKSNLDIYDECNFSYLDILKEKEVEVVCKAYMPCKCTSSVNFNTYYSKCDKCDGKGKIILNNNEVICNRCKGKGKIVKESCPLCNGEGNIIKKGKVLVKLNNKLTDNDILVVSGKGKIGEELKGDLFIKVKINDLKHFEIKGNDVYDRRVINFSKEDIAKGVSKKVETIQGFSFVKSRGEELFEIVKLDKQGINDGDYYICLKNELSPIKGKDVYKNVVVDENELGFYINKEQLKSENKCLDVYYYKQLNESNYEYVDLGSANNFKIVKLKEKGLAGIHGGSKGDLYLRVFFSSDFVSFNNTLYHKPIKLNKYEVMDGKKIVEFEKEKISLIFPKNISEVKEISVKDYGFMTNKNVFEEAKFVVNPFEYELYNVSVKVNKNDKIIYLRDYKKYFKEFVKINYSEGLMVNLNKKRDVVETMDEIGNKVIVNVVR